MAFFLRAPPSSPFSYLSSSHGRTGNGLCRLASNFLLGFRGGFANWNKRNREFQTL